MGIFRRSGADGQALRLYFASDVHGSGVCWRKFINAGVHYRAQVLIMGGDLTGKGLTPVVRRNGEFVARVIGEERSARTDRELEELERAISTNGMYPYRTDEAEADRLRHDPGHAGEVFERQMIEELRGWLAFAEGRLANSDAEVYVIAGNDDPWEIDEVLTASTRIVCPDEQIRRVGGHEMLSFGWSNRTPWNSPRELDEDELYRRLRRLADELESPERAIFNIHVPPRASGLDTACEIDEDFRPVFKGGQPHQIPIGSAAVRQLIEEVQPVLSLHGHVHESRGIAQLGRTISINPGSDYGSGRLDGCIVDLRGAEVIMHRLVSG
jgi:Icc-related predicted phosphoesterase